MWFLFGLLTGGLVCGLWRMLVNRAQKAEHEDEISRIRSAREEAEIGYFSVLCRELANELIRRNPDRFVELTDQIVMEVEEIQRLSKENALVRLKGMAQNYWEYSAFDGVGTKNYVLYEDGLAGTNDIEIEKRYRDIQIWCALNSVSNKPWRFTGECISTEKRLEEIEEYVSRYKDTLLLYQLKSAKRDYDLYQDTLFDLDDELELVEENSISQKLKFFKNENFEVHPLGLNGPNAPMESAWLVKVLATGEYGCWSVFYDDKIFVSYFKVGESDIASPDKWQSLRGLMINEPRFSPFLPKASQES